MNKEDSIMTVAVELMEKSHIAGVRYKWKGLSQTDAIGAYLPVPGDSDITVWAVGDFGGGTLIMKGTIDKGVDPEQLDDTFGLGLTFTDNGAKPVGPAVPFMRPELDSATGGDVDVYVYIIKKK
jgi:hypothetical protein